MLVHNRLFLNHYRTTGFAVVLAILTVGSAIFLTLLFKPLLQPTPTPLFFAALLLSAAWGGRGAGLLATALSIFAIHYLTISPSSLAVQGDELLRLGVFSLVALLINWQVEAHRRSEERVQASQAQLQLIVEAIPVPLAYVDASLHYCFNNQAYRDWFGVSLEDLKGKLITSVVGETVYQTIQPRLETVLAGESVCFEGYIPCKNTEGGDRYIQETYVPDLGEQGEVRGFVALVNDFTQIGQTEESLRKAQEQLERQVETEHQAAQVLALVDALLVATPIGIGFLDKELRHIRINQVLADINGLSVEQHLGKRLGELFPDKATQFEQQLQTILDTGEAQLNVEFGGEAPGQPGRFGYWLANYYPVGDGQGQTVGIGIIVADITVRKQAEQALRVAEERLQIALKNSPITLFNQDQALRYTWIYNPAFDRQVEAVVGQRDEDLLPIDDARVLTRIKRLVLETGVGKREEVKITQQGRDWYYDLTVEPERDAIGSVIGVTCVAIDISERQAALRDRNLAEAALRQSEERYRAFIEQSTEGIWRFELEKPIAIELSEDEQIERFYDDGYLAECNQAMAAMYGFEQAEELVGLRVKDFLVRSLPQNEAYLRAFIRSHYRLSDAQSYEVDRFGNPKFFSNNLVGIVEEGCLVRAWGNQRDITERKRAEETLHFLAQTSSLLATSLDYEATLQSVAQISVSGLADLCTVDILQDDGSIQRKAIAYVDPAQVIEEAASSAAQRLVPYYLVEKVVRTGQPELIPEISDELLVRVSNAQSPEIACGLGLKSALVVPLIARQRSLGAITFLTSQSGHRYDTTDLAVAEDLACRAALAIDNARLYHAATTSRAQAEVANRIKDEFLAVLSHELRTPLNPILGWAKILRTRKIDEAKRAAALETIERNALLQTQLIEDLLDVSRILRGKIHLNISLVDLVATVAAAQETVRLAAEAKSIEIRTVFAPDARQVLGDANRLQQVVWNLLSNAVKFTPAGGRVEIKLERLGSNIQMLVQDTGKGILPEFLPHVFDYFRQENSSTTRVFGGLGLGLAIVRHLVELHGGKVRVSSPGVGQGATFTVILPVLDVVPSEREASVPRDEPNLAGIQVLMIDDEKDSLELVVFILEQYGASVQAFASATEALTVLENLQADVLVSDIGMPEMDGYMLMRQLRSLPPEQGGEIPAIALTAYAGETDHQQILQAGFQKHITKPVEPILLAEAIANLIGRPQKMA